MAQQKFELQSSNTTVLAGQAGKSITVSRIAAASLAGANITFNGKTVAVDVKAADLSDALGLPVTFPQGADFALTVDNPGASVSGFALAVAA